MALSYVDEVSFTYPSGIASLVANFTADETHFYIAGYLGSNTGRLFVYNHDGTRASGNDITLSNHPHAGVEGLTKTHDGKWVIVTQFFGITTHRGLSLYSATGSREASVTIPTVVSGFSTATNPLTAPRAVAEIASNYYVSISQSISPEPPDRLLKYNTSLQLQTDDIEVPVFVPATATESALDDIADIASNNYRYALVVPINTYGVYGLDSENIGITYLVYILLGQMHQKVKQAMGLFIMLIQPLR